jgi:hypothetical protein
MFFDILLEAVVDMYEGLDVIMATRAHKRCSVVLGVLVVCISETMGKFCNANLMTPCQARESPP